MTPAAAIPTLPLDPPADLTDYLEGTDLGSLGPFFADDNPALVRCATPELSDYTWDYSGARLWTPACCPRCQ
jgi:hypothetical protein